jgi:uncharacterized membrane protein
MFHATSELPQDSIAVAALNGEDEWEAELRAVTFVELGDPRSFRWRALVEAGAVLLAGRIDRQIAAYVRHFFNLRHKGRTVWAIPVSAALGAFALAVAIVPSRPELAKNFTFSEVRRIVAVRCAVCHAEAPTQPGFTIATKGLLLDTATQIAAHAQKINEQAVLSKVMPIGNLTQMTDAERATLAAWIAAGAPDK